MNKVNKIFEITKQIKDDLLKLETAYLSSEKAKLNANIHYNLGRLEVKIENLLDEAKNNASQL